MEEGRRFRAFFSGLWLAGNERMKKKMQTTIMGHMGTTIGSHSLAGRGGVQRVMWRSFASFLAVLLQSTEPHFFAILHHVA